MKFILLFMLIALASCGDPVKHDARFNPVIEQFVKDARTFGKSVDVSKVRISFDDIHAPLKILGFKIRYKSQSENMEAYCAYLKRDVTNDLKKAVFKVQSARTYDYMVIKLDNSLKRKSALYLESLLYHELGHCVLNLPHNDSESIMATYGIYSLEGFRYFDVQELFQRRHTQPQTLIGKSLKELQEYKLIYQSDYHFWGERLFYQLYLDEKNNQYYYNEKPEN